MRYAPVCAVVVTGLALYVSRGVLDQVITANGLVRVALLPPWETLAAFVALGGLGLLWLDRRAVPRGTATAVRPPLGPLVLPLFGLVLLLLPYLPFLADTIPALQMLAGPLRAIVWLVIVAQLAWVLWQTRLLRADWLGQWTLTRLAVAIGLATALVSGAVAARLTGTVLYPAGDEPHYLIMAQSLWRDGDLKIENNHARRDYGEYFAPDLAPHYLTRGADGEIYSIHPIGISVLLAPIYAAAGYRGVVFAIVIAAAIAASLMWLAVVRMTNAAGAATFAWAAIVFTAPFLFNSFAVYPEIAAALAVTIGFTRAIDRSLGSGLWRWLPVGIVCAVLPWLSTKYAPMSAALVTISLARILWPDASGFGDVLAAIRSKSRSRLRAAAVPSLGVLIPYAISLALWFSFFYWIWGTPWPQAPYGPTGQTAPLNLTFGAPGLLFDQEYGLLPYAPVFVLAATGLWLMWRDRGEPRRRAIEIVLTFAALVSTVGAYRIWWGGTAAPGRPITSGLLLFMLPMAIAFRTAPAGSARRAGQHVLLWLSIGVAGLLAVAQDGSLTLNGRDGTSSVLEYLSPRWPTWTAAPSFTYHEPLTALAHSAAWLALAATAAWLLRRLRTPRPGAASLAAISVCSAALLTGALVVPRLPAAPAWPGIDVRARPRTALLEEFDAVARPVGVAYEPLDFVAAAAVTAQSALEVTPGTRAEQQPVRVLHNGRFSLPAGHYRLDVEWGGTRTGESIGLQIGRTGDAWRTWQVEPRPGERWTTEFTLPIDAGFVGLRGSPELERSTSRISITPISIVDAARRPRLPAITGASPGNGADYFYCDDNALPEARGFWVRGGRTTRVTIHRERAEGPLRLRLNSGLIQNQLQISTLGWSKTMTLEAKMPEYLEIPTPDRALVTLELHADREFVPRQLDPSSNDPRALGVWIEVVQP